MAGRGSKQLLASGRRAEGATHLQCAVALYREVGASAYLRETEVLLAATASALIAAVAFVQIDGFRGPASTPDFHRRHKLDLRGAR